MIQMMEVRKRITRYLLQKTFNEIENESNKSNQTHGRVLFVNKK
jgi:hypothetical protein